MNRCRLALVGAGVVGKRHIAAIGESEGGDLVAVADPSPAARETVSVANVDWFETAEAMIDAVRPDGVIVATPTDRHLAPALAALEAGAHVLVEKPITATVDEANMISAASARTGLHVLVGHHRRYYPAIHKARELVQGGAIGALVAVTGQWSILKPDSYFEPLWRRERPSGPILTNLIHDMDLLRYVCGDVVGVSAETAGGIRGHAKEETAAMVLTFANGALGTFIMSDATPSPWTFEQATGENAAFPKSGLNMCRFMGTEAALDFPNLVLWRQRPGQEGWTHPIFKEEIPFEHPDAFVAQIDHFCAVIAGTETPRITAEDATNSLRATLAVFDAAEAGRRIMV